MTTPRLDPCVLETAMFHLLNGVVEPGEEVATKPEAEQPGGRGSRG